MFTWDIEILKTLAFAMTGLFIIWALSQEPRPWD